MSRSVREEVVIAADPERVWETIMDPTRLEQWVSAHDSVNGAAPGALDEGDSFKQRLRLAGKSFGVEWRVVEADPPNLARWEGAGPAGSKARVRYCLEGEDGGTRFVYENVFELPGGVLGKAAGAMLSAAPGKREARKSLERLRVLLEDG